jgi:anti-sigma-K factor RskA
MIGEHLQDTAINYVLGQLSAPEAAQFHEALSGDRDLRALVRELETTATSLALTVPPVQPRSGVLPSILNEIRSAGSTQRPASHLGWVPWALAACLAIACAVLGLGHARLRHEIAALQEKDELARVRIASLGAQIDAFSKVRAVVFWDSQKQRGIAQFNDLPPLDEEHDYQIWVIDPSQPQPVSGGIVYVQPDGSARLVFQPSIKIEQASQFAISVEAKGGSSKPAPQGQIVMAGN